MTVPRSVELLRLDNDMPLEVWEEDPRRLRVLFQGHDGVFCLRTDYPQSARIRALAEEAIRQQARVWFVAQAPDLTLADVLPAE